MVQRYMFSQPYWKSPSCQHRLYASQLEHTGDPPEADVYKQLELHDSRVTKHRGAFHDLHAIVYSCLFLTCFGHQICAVHPDSFFLLCTPLPVGNQGSIHVGGAIQLPDCVTKLPKGPFETVVPKPYQVLAVAKDAEIPGIWAADDEQQN